MKSVSYHRYPTTHCNGNTPTLAELLADSSSIGQADSMKAFAQEAISLGLQYWIGETNSASCGGFSGVSDVMGTTLWAVDYMMALAAIGVAGVNYHGGPAGAYTPIGYDKDPKIPDVRPLYYAMLLFARATSHYSTIQEVKTTTDNPKIKVWAVKNSGGYNVVVVHKDISATSAADVTVTGPVSLTGKASLLVLEALSVNAKNGLRFADQTFDGSTDGKIQGTYSPIDVSPSGGAYKISVKPGTIALLELPAN